MSDENLRKARHIVIQVGLFCVVFAALYLTGFAVAVKLGPGLSPPISTVLEFVYWPLIKELRTKMLGLGTAALPRSRSRPTFPFRFI